MVMDTELNFFIFFDQANNIRWHVSWTIERKFLFTCVLFFAAEFMKTMYTNSLSNNFEFHLMSKSTFIHENIFCFRLTDTRLNDLNSNR